MPASFTIQPIDDEEGYDVPSVYAIGTAPDRANPVCATFPEFTGPE